MDDIGNTWWFRDDWARVVDENDKQDEKMDDENEGLQVCIRDQKGPGMAFVWSRLNATSRKFPLISTEYKR